tara:strand:- start:382 stop:654 length:273 start_codon:yes stop_codon:yes gene_type:complete
MPFSNKNTARRRRIIYRSLHLGLTYFSINEALDKQNEKPLAVEDYEVWKSLIYPIASKDDLMKKAIIEEGKSLAWVAEKINKRRQAQTIS